jgi:formylmethanofuran dehydrogenase subunit E
MWRNKRQLVKGKCASCGKDIITTPKFSDNVKIYCKDCYDEHNEKNDNIIK